VLGIDHQRIPQHALHWKVQGFNRGPDQPRTNWRGVVKKDLQRMGLTWVKVEVAALDSHNGVGVWPNTFTWMWDEAGIEDRPCTVVWQLYTLGYYK